MRLPQERERRRGIMGIGEMHEYAKGMQKTNQALLKKKEEREEKREIKQSIQLKQL